jgi:hypothetical protein
MTKRVKTGGRQRGTPNRNTKALLERLQEEHPNYCPLSELAKIATDEATPVELKVQCHKTIASYIVPKVSPITSHEFDVRNGLEKDPYADLFAV